LRECRASHVTERPVTKLSSELRKVHERMS
jgi:hypothetical protein